MDCREVQRYISGGMGWGIEGMKCPVHLPPSLSVSHTLQGHSLFDKHHVRPARSLSLPPSHALIRHMRHLLLGAKQVLCDNNDAFKKK